MNDRAFSGRFQYELQNTHETPKDKNRTIFETVRHHGIIDITTVVVHRHRYRERVTINALRYLTHRCTDMNIHTRVITYKSVGRTENANNVACGF